MSETSGEAVVRRAALALGVPSRTFAPLGGATGCTWASGDVVIRLGDADVLAREVEVMAAVAAAVPVPEVLAHARLDGDGGADATAAVLLERLPGAPAGDLAACTPEQARRRGSWCGDLHARLAAVPAPDGLPVVATDPETPPSSAHSVLHLDLHLFNVLVDDDSAEVTGVLDWANTAAGDPDLDRARSWSILTQDPHVRPYRDHPVWIAFVEGWAAAAELATIPVSARLWAARFMLADLGGRVPPGDLARVERLVEHLQGAGTD